MKQIRMSQGQIEAPAISLGCMRIANMAIAEASQLLHTSLELGINFFDHADIYGGGQSEAVFAQALGMNASIREKVVIQTKCGIRSGYFDFSKSHILQSVEASLQRLQTDYVDMLLLHRPDTLMEPEEIAEAFDHLHTSGKVNYFGVSNLNPMQIELLQKYVKQPLFINQLQFSMTNTGMIDAGFNVNMQNQASINRDGSILEYCRLKDITIQAWSPLLYGFFEGFFLGNKKFPELNAQIDAMAHKYNVPPIAIPIAWILRHPAHMQAIVGTTNVQRLRDIAQAASVELTRQDWYALYVSAGNKLP